MFIDKVSVLVKAGDGGNGIVSWRKEPFVDRGGPNGGDGGDGGDVVFKADPQVNNLGGFRHKQRLDAEKGGNGAKSNRHGKNGVDKVVKVPIGTVVYRGEHQVADISKPRQEVVVAFGGSGGFGNAHFKSSRRQAPKVAEKGEKGEQTELNLELKLLADVGLIGLPNAGKSTLLSRVSNATPEIADYPFTTLTPNLGVADKVDGESLLIADIPGLIEGASEGKGLGGDFLRHIERTAVLIHLIDVYGGDPVADYKAINKELANYKVDLTARAEIVALSKTEGLDDKTLKKITDDLKKASKTDVIAISSMDGTNLKELLKAALKHVKEFRKTEAEAAAAAEKDDGVEVLTLTDENKWEIHKEGDIYVIRGKKINKFASRTDYENDFGLMRLRDIMGKTGILHELDRMGAEPGDTVQVGNNPSFEL